MKRKHRALPIVHVRWDDSRSITQSWDSRKRTQREARRTVPIDSVGIVLEESKKHLLIALDYDPETDQVNNASMIPKSAIRSRRTLGKL